MISASNEGAVMDNKWTIEGYEFAVMQALNEGLCARTFDFSSLVEKGLCAKAGSRFKLTSRGEAVLQALQYDIENFDPDDEDEEDDMAYDGPLMRADIEFDSRMEDAEYVSMEHIRLKHPKKAKR